MNLYNCVFHSIFEGKSLIWVAILGLIVLFIYAVIAFALLHNQFIITDSANLYCDTLAQCMYSVMRYGLIGSIGLVRELVMYMNCDSNTFFTAHKTIPIITFLYNVLYIII